jgi:predicted AlkP superfamily phosphohydrolase/phosphomutase
MFWRYLDTSHPLYEKSPQFQDTVYKYYEKMDKIVGEVYKRLDKDTLLIVLSDHGFNSFRKAVNLNRWLLEKGYLYLKDGKRESGEFFENVDWSKTKAYSLGFGGIYLNKAGREYYGIVGEEEAKKLKREIVAGLEAARDPQSQDKLINKVYPAEDIFSGPNKSDGPDLFAGFNTGYRASWKTALGAVPAALIENNDKKWSGDHLVDPALVPGVIWLNRKVKLTQPAITDIAPTVLRQYGLPVPEEMRGRDLLSNKD